MIVPLMPWANCVVVTDSAKEPRAGKKKCLSSPSHLTTNILWNLLTPWKFEQGIPFLSFGLEEAFLKHIKRTFFPLLEVLGNSGLSSFFFSHKTIVVTTSQKKVFIIQKDAGQGWKWGLANNTERQGRRNIPAVIFKGENHRVFRRDKGSFLDGLNNIL